MSLMASSWHTDVAQQCCFVYQRRSRTIANMRCTMSTALLGAPARLVCWLALCLIHIAVSNPIPSDCKEQWYTQRLDHFRWAHQVDQPTFQQRYFLCDAHWKPDGPVFFYAGNEGPLEGYLKSAGLMFENREQHGALVLFAEVRLENGFTVMLASQIEVAAH